MILLATAIGPFPWPAPPGAEHHLGAERIRALALAYDGVLGEFLDDLEARGLGEELLLLFTRDHGLRFRREFASLGEAVTTELAFNVPFLLDAPEVRRQPRPPADGPPPGDADPCGGTEMLTDEEVRDALREKRRLVAAPLVEASARTPGSAPQ